MGLISNLFKASKHFTIIKPDFDLMDRINDDFNVDSDLLTVQLTCEKYNADQIAKLPVEVYRSDNEQGKIKDKAHRLYEPLHNSPNSYQTSTLFFQQIERWRGHYGNAWAKIHTNKSGYAESFELFHPTQIKGYKFVNGKLLWYREWEESGRAKKEILNNDMVLHFRWPSEDGVLGINPTHLLIHELQNIYQGKTTLNNAYKNNLNIDKYIQSDIANFKGKQAEESINELRKAYSGAQNSRKTPVLPPGFKIATVQGASIQDGQVLQSIGFSKADIHELYGVPVPEKKSYNSIEQETINYKTNTLQPIARMYRQELEKKLLFPQDIEQGISIEFNLNAVVEVDLKTRSEYLKAMHHMGVISSNTIAKMEGFETYEGGDKHYIQSQYIPVEEYEKFAKANQNKPVTTNSDNNDQES
jgi:HK97 family phage portal protein